MHSLYNKKLINTCFKLNTKNLSHGASMGTTSYPLFKFKNHKKFSQKEEINKTEQKPQETSDKNLNSSQSTNDYTSFGYKSVKKEERQSLVNTVFANVASSYDIMNDAMSLGIHRIWKNEFVNSIGLLRHNTVYDAEGKSREEKLKIIDVAGGTGDIAFRIWEKARNDAKSYFTTMPVEITVVDINANMLEVGKSRAKSQNIPEEDIKWVESNAETLSFLPDNSVDLYTISFGIRNCTEIDKVLREAHRILKKGGRFMCMEFSKVTLPVLSNVYDFYSFYMIPEMGRLIAGDKESYQYLVESIRNFPDQETFKRKIEDAGFKSVKYVNLSAGIVAIHSGIKL
jgi:2-methoxy-6-polyprenyl-1,4-benzoquinol methylase